MSVLQLTTPTMVTGCSASTCARILGEAVYNAAILHQALKTESDERMKCYSRTVPGSEAAVLVVL